MKKKKKKKVNKRKFLSRIFFLVILVAIIIFITKGSGEKDEDDFAKTIFVNNENITAKLVEKPYINKDNVLYLSITDIKNIFDKNIYYEEETRKIITTSGNKVAAIDIDNSSVEINSANLSLEAGVLDYGNNFYIPISKLTNIYNIEAKTTDKTAVLSSLYEELTTIKVTAKTSIKEKTSGFSKTLQKISADTEVIYIGEAEKNGWIKVLTYEGNMGYIKNKKVTDKECKRVKMNDDEFYSGVADISNSIEVNKTKLSNDKLNNYNNRTNIVENIISDMISKSKFTININLKDVNVETRYLERLVIELLPRIKEIGGKVMLTNNNILSSDFVAENKL